MSSIEWVKFALTVVSFLINIKLLSLLFKFNNQWRTVLERCDILWMDYCQAHKIPFRSVGKDFPQSPERKFEVNP